MSESIAYLGMLLILGAFVFETKDMLIVKIGFILPIATGPGLLATEALFMSGHF